MEERDDSDRGGGGLKDGVDEQVIAGPKRDDEPADAREDDDEDARVRWQQAAGSDDGRGVGGGGGGRRVCRRVLSTSNGVTASRTGSQRARSVRRLARADERERTEDELRRDVATAPVMAPTPFAPILVSRPLSSAGGGGVGTSGGDWSMRWLSSSRLNEAMLAKRYEKGGRSCGQKGVVG